MFIGCTKQRKKRNEEENFEKDAQMKFKVSKIYLVNNLLFIIAQ